MTKGAIKHAAAGAVEGMKQRAKAYMVASLMGRRRAPGEKMIDRLRSR